MEEIDFKFCPKCGGKFVKKENNLLVCATCDLHYYINPRPTSDIIFEDRRGRILLVKRKYPPKKGYYDLPGGFVDIGETAEESVRREIQEELGIKLGKIAYLGSYKARYSYGGVKFYTVATTYTSVLPPDQKIAISSDITEVAYFAKDKIPFDRLAFEGISAALKDYLNKN